MHKLTLLLGLAILVAACGEDDAPAQPNPDLAAPDAAPDQPDPADLADDLAPDQPDPADLPPGAWSPDGGSLLPTPTTALRLVPDAVIVVAGQPVTIAITVEGALRAADLALEGAPAGMVAAFSDARAGHALTLTPDAALEGSYTLIVSAKIDGQRRAAPLLVTVSRSPERGVIVGGVLMDSLRRPLVGERVRLSNPLDPAQAVTTDAQGRFTATVAALPWSLAFSIPGPGRARQDVAVLDISTPLAVVAAPHLLGAAPQDEEAALAMQPAQPQDLSRSMYLWAAGPGASPAHTVAPRLLDPPELPVRWSGAGQRAHALALELERVEGSGQLLPRRMARADVALGAGRLPAASLTRMSAVDHALIHLASPPLSAARDAQPPTLQLALCLNAQTRFMLPPVEAEAAVIAAPLDPARDPLVPCAQILLYDGDRSATVTLGQVASGALYRAPALADAALTPRPAATASQITWPLVRGASYVLVGQPRLDARGFAVVTARPTIALAELVALGLQPAGANSQRGLTLHTLHDAPLPALLSAQDHRLGLDYLTPQIITTHRATY